MTDLEMTRLCAEAFGHSTPHEVNGKMLLANSTVYAPLHDDAQAMALVKKLKLSISREHHGDRWGVGVPWPEAMNADLNRAIVECVAKMQKSK
jgi:hypothetical protein